MWGSIRAILGHGFILSTFVRRVIIKRLHARSHIQRTNPIYRRVKSFGLRRMEKVYRRCRITGCHRQMLLAPIEIMDFTRSILQSINRFAESSMVSLDAIHWQKNFLGVLELWAHGVRLLQVDPVDVFSRSLRSRIRMMQLVTTHASVI